MDCLGLRSAAQAGCFPPSPSARADTLAIKQRLSDLLPADDGIVYWTALVGFVQGKLDRTELESATSRALASSELRGLHNALVLSILYNTTRSAAIPQTARSHIGWNKRKRRPDGSKVEDQDPKRRRLKEAAFDLGKRERGRLKSIILFRDARKDTAAYLKSERPPSASTTALGPKIRISSSSLAQDYMRGLQVATCVDAKQLPDISSLKDKMSLAAYDHGMGAGADASAAAILLIAVEVHLRALISDTLSLSRVKRSAEPEPPSRLSDAAATTSDGALPSSADLRGASLTQRSLSSGSGTSAPRSASPRGLGKPLSAEDVANLAEIAPYTFVQAHPGVLERFEAFKGLQDASDDENLVVGDHQELTRSPGSARMQEDRSPISRAAIQLSEAERPDRSANAKVAQSSRAQPALAALPGSPTGTVDRTGMGAPSKGSTGLARIVNGSRRSTTEPDGTAASRDAEHGRAPSKNLADELFPEEDDAAKGAAVRPSRAFPDGAGSGSESDDAPVTAGAPGGMQRKKKHGWDRVDTFRLLEGVGHA